MQTESEKKSAAIWRNEPFLGKMLPSNFGLPPYHFRCRTELVPVWIDSEQIDGVLMNNTSPLNKDEVIKHIDKTGVERVLSNDRWGHILLRAGTHPKDKATIIKALNSITDIASHEYIKDRSVAISQNGYFMVFEGDKLWTIFKPDKGCQKYFKEYAKINTREVIKWRILGF